MPTRTSNSVSSVGGGGGGDFLIASIWVVALLVRLYFDCCMNMCVVRDIMLVELIFIAELAMYKYTYYCCKGYYCCFCGGGDVVVVVVRGGEGEVVGWSVGGTKIIQ